MFIIVTNKWDHSKILLNLDFVPCFYTETIGCHYINEKDQRVRILESFDDILNQVHQKQFSKAMDEIIK